MLQRCDAFLGAPPGACRGTPLCSGGVSFCAEINHAFSVRIGPHATRDLLVAIQMRGLERKVMFRDLEPHCFVSSLLYGFRVLSEWGGKLRASASQTRRRSPCARELAAALFRRCWSQPIPFFASVDSLHGKSA